MVQEITVSTGLNAVKGNMNMSVATANVKYDMAGTHKFQNIQNIGFAAHEAIEISTDLGTPGWAYFRNLDDTNFIELGLVVAATFYSFCRLLPGEKAQFPIGGTLYAKADTAACQLESDILER